jgi:hypothetical protein
VDELSERFLDALDGLEAVADQVTSDEAPARLDEAALEVFWREWPRLGAWAGAVWRQVDRDLALPSSGVTDPELDEVGGEGG